MRHICVMILSCFSCILFAQMTKEEYIERYSGTAIREMERSGVPASITLAQGLLESGNGNSRLATEGNNHFGIKCHKWTGATIYEDDDEKHECFRKYNNADESFRDHSDFLRNNSRYAFLFDYRPDDYTSWAHGLRKAGYATDPKYPQKLIQLIEDFDLHKYDSATSTNKPIAAQPTIGTTRHTQPDKFVINPYKNEVLYNNGVPYIVVSEAVTLKDFAREIDLMPWQLALYNDLSRTDTLRAGDWIYIKSKRQQAEAGKATHSVEAGETLRSISQRYAVKIKRLRKYNNLPENSEPSVGTKLNLRKRKK